MSTARPSRLEPLARFLVRRARPIVGAWLVAAIVLGALGSDLESKLNTEPLYIDGTVAKRAHDITVREFGGGEDAMIVMLRGPGPALDRQGPALVRRLAAMPRTAVVSPWDPGATIGDLRPSPGVAALIVRIDRSPGQEVADLLPPVQRRIDAVVAQPVGASVAGLPAILSSYRDAAEAAALLGELIALPALLLILLFVFRSVLAALMPVLIGGAVVVATRGLLSIATEVVQINVFAMALVGMLGLALGVDYSLLTVSRFREERRRRDPVEAMQVTVAASARAIVPAGCGLILAMLVAPLVFPRALANSVSVAVTTLTLLSMLSALCVVPAMLTVLGDNLDRWSLPQRRSAQAAPLRWSRRLTHRPRAVIAIVTGLLLCATLAFTLESRVATVDLLPAGDPGRQQQEAIERGLGPGWVGPMEVVVESREGPIVSPRRLDALAEFQRRIERDRGVEAVTGFAEIERGASRVDGFQDGLAAQQDGLDRLEAGLARAHDGSVLGARGLRTAAEGSRQLNAGVGAAGDGADLLAHGLDAVSTGSDRLSRGLGSAAEGSGELSDGAAEVREGAGRLADGIEQAQEGAGQMLGTARLFRNAMRTGEERLAELHAPLGSAEERLAAAWDALQRMTTGRSDPEYAAALRAVQEASRGIAGTDPATGEPADPSYDGVEAGIEAAAAQFDVGVYLAGRLDKSGRQAEEGIAELARGSARLDRGLERLADGSARLSEGIAALSEGGAQLSPALVRLSDGAARLQDGLAELGAGSGTLADGLGGGAQEAKLLSGGLGRIGTGLRRSRGPGASDMELLREQSPGLFRSGYLVLAGLDGSRPRERAQIGSLVSLDAGGQAARMLVIPRFEPASVEARRIKDRLVRETGTLERRAGVEAAVGGATPNDIEINDVMRDRTLLLRLTLALITFLVLLPVVRSLALALLAAVVNLVMVSATFGLLALFFNTSLLGGPGYVDVTVIPATVMLVFGLAIDYEVFVFARMREEYVRTGSSRAAIENGLGHTAHVVTGAALIMIAVFLAFSVSSFMPIRNIGVAQAIGVFLDAFVIRLVVIPAAMIWLGRWCWWMPSWLDRLLPGGSGSPGVPVPAAATQPG